MYSKREKLHLTKNNNIEERFVGDKIKKIITFSLLVWWHSSFM